MPKRKRPSKFKKVLPLIASGVLLGIFFIFLKLIFPIFKIKTISCQLNDQPCPEKLTQALDPLKNTSFFFSPLPTQIAQLELKLYQLEKIAKRWPGEIFLSFSHKPRSYLLSDGNESQKVLVAEDGFLSQAPTESNLPLIRLFSWPGVKIPFSENTQLNPKLHQFSLELLQALAANQIGHQALIIHHPQEIEIILDDNLSALTSQTDIATQIKKLALILEEVDLGAIDLSLDTIDLRFDLAVLRSRH